MLGDSTRRRRFSITVAVILCMVTAVVMFVRAGDFLALNDLPQPSDAIIVLGGEPFIRVEKAVELYNEGYAPKIILSGGNLSMDQYTEAETMAITAEQMGVPRSHLLLENRAATTYQNAVFTKAIMLQHQLTSAIVVSSDFHMRRAQLIFSRVYRGTGIRLLYVGAPTRDFSPNRWWSNSDSAEITISEYVKILAAIVGIHD